ncbi:LysR substrate-binding domain-containing protein [Nitrosomonas sp. ANs5]|uniref:LysR substrate-binding domain-containing protein n=1 Tax=Nitrosomonas sp. ANs5 TaxID=3423941 RepID=UPI003D34396F
MRDAAIAGLGIAILPLFIASKALMEGRLINALPSANPVADTIYAVYPLNRHVPKKVRIVIDHLVTMFHRNLPWEKDLQL